MEKRIIFATGNQNKMKEIHMILADLGMPIYSMKEAGIDIDIVEDGTTFEENAQIKAKAIAKYLPDDIILADDSGLEIAGEHGFGYDPIFYVPEYGCTTAEMDPVQKNELSHRGRALRAMRAIMEVKEREE